MSADMLRVSELGVRYGSAQALANVSFAVQAGETLAVFGANGAGKSTLARALSGLVRSSGSIVLDGRDVSNTPAHRRSRSGLAHLPETRGIFPALTVSDNLRMAALQVPSKQRKDLVERALAVAPKLGQRLGQVAGTLSGGEQQILALGRVIAVDPKIVVIDELSIGLAPKIVDEVYLVLAEARRQQNLTVILIEQFVNRALAVSDHCIVLRRGSITWKGTAEQARSSGEIDYLVGAEPTGAREPGTAEA